MKQLFILLIIALLSSSIFSENFYTITQISQTSYLEDDNPFLYQATSLFDGDLDTVWADGNPENYRKNDHISIEFENPIELDEIRIAPGYFNTGLFNANNRIKKLQIKFDTHPSYDDAINAEFQDVMEIQSINIETKISVKTITFIIKEVYSGSKWDDTCISEIEFYNQNNKIQNNHYQSSTNNLGELRNYEYDTNGNIIRETYDYFVRSGGSRGSIKYFWDWKNENILFSIDNENDFPMVELYTYEENLLTSIEGRMYEGLYSHNSIKKFEYDETGRLIKEYKELPDGKQKNIKKYTYANNKLINMTSYDYQNRETIRTYIYSGQIEIGYIENSKNGQLHFQYIFDDNGNKVALLTGDGKSLKLSANYKYNGQGFLEEERHYY